VDSVQRRILMFLWLCEQNTTGLTVLRKITRTSFGELTLAVERLEQNGFILRESADVRAIVKLLMDGREYVKARGLDKVTKEESREINDRLRE